MSQSSVCGRVLLWTDFQRQRLSGQGSRGQGFLYGFELQFAEAVSGPLALGYGCHFGLGFFSLWFRRDKKPGHALNKLNAVPHFLRFVDDVDEQQSLNRFSERQPSGSVIDDTGKQHAACQPAVRKS